jgi:hypothetical protein
MARAQSETRVREQARGGNDYLFSLPETQQSLGHPHSTTAIALYTLPFPSLPFTSSSSFLTDRVEHKAASGLRLEQAVSDLL